LTVWDSAAGGAAAALMRSAVSNEAIASMLREFVVNRILKRAAKELGVDPAEAPLRTNLVATQISGLVLMRYILKIEPLASLPRESVVELIGPTIQRYLGAPLTTDAAPATTPRRREPAPVPPHRRGSG
jgi:hypothetical protein